MSALVCYTSGHCRRVAPTNHTQTCKQMGNNTTLFDLTYLRKFTNNDEAKVGKYIQTYLRTSERIFNELEKAGRDGNWDDAYSKAHTVKPQVQYMGIGQLMEIILEIENRAKIEPGAVSLADLVEQAIDIYKRSSIELMTYLQGRDGDPQ